MEAKLLNVTKNPIGLIYKAYRVCYSKFDYDELMRACPNIPTAHVLKLDKEDEDAIQKQMNFISDKCKLSMKTPHTSPLEHVSMTWYLKDVPRYVMAQLTRHRTGKFNVQSQRYVNAEAFGFDMPDLQYLDDVQREAASAGIKLISETLIDAYEKLIELGVRKEDARTILPEATTCNMIVTMDLGNFVKYLAQRLDKSAQGRHRELAGLMLNAVESTDRYLAKLILDILLQ